MPPRQALGCSLSWWSSSLSIFYPGSTPESFNRLCHRRRLRKRGANLLRCLGSPGISNRHPVADPGSITLLSSGRMLRPTDVSKAATVSLSRSPKHQPPGDIDLRSLLGAGPHGHLHAVVDFGKSDSFDVHPSFLLPSRFRRRAFASSRVIRENWSTGGSEHCSSRSSVHGSIGLGPAARSLIETTSAVTIVSKGP